MTEPPGSWPASSTHSQSPPRKRHAPRPCSKVARQPSILMASAFSVLPLRRRWMRPAGIFGSCVIGCYPMLEPPRRKPPMMSQSKRANRGFAISQRPRVTGFMKWTPICGSPTSRIASSRSFRSHLPKSSARPGRSLPAANLMSPIGRSTILTSSRTAPFETLPTARQWRTVRSVILKSAVNQFSAVVVSSLGTAVPAAMIETVTEGFALYDDHDRLILCNSRYTTLMQHGFGLVVQIGDTFESIVRRAVEKALIPAAQDDPEKWICDRVAKHREPAEPIVLQSGDGRWYQISERKTRDDGIVVVYSDLTDIKRHEAELQATNQRFRDVAEVAGDWIYEMDENLRFTFISDRFFEIFPISRDTVMGKTRQEFAAKSLEAPHWQAHYRDLNARKPFRNFEYDVTLPNKDLRFLQISGKPVFAPDGAFKGYRGTGTDITELRLREQQLAAKYIGDAIMIFFGDPETRGVAEDALACVKMAVAMQKRIRQLAAIWRDAGIERPLTCRMGIHTGYCTVGNFGSEDRVSYTVVGSGVNLASRLEHEAPPGEILISYETFAHVKDEISCEEVGKMGIAYPVTTYRVVDDFETLAETGEALRARLPHLTLNLDPGRMTAEEQVQARELLQNALERLDVELPRGATLTAPSPLPTPKSLPNKMLRKAGWKKGRPRSKASF